MSKSGGVGKTAAALGITDAKLIELLKSCEKVKCNAYSRYSHFRVGAALLTTPDDKGIIITGCNIENASSGMTVCAERTAICYAVAQGHRTFHCIAVTSDIDGRFCAPCGACRQVIIEFAPNSAVILMKPGFSDEQYINGEGLHLTTIKELLPFGFTPDDLAMPQIAHKDPYSS
ncbi:cytidine deaminase-like [Paramacrobiotus metropolitanus]|uniref:cytidine deaminase-like n=1 Tax=Paramacrobiotus metropolitanus TaxID=2943436 RepID=UPI0024462C2C|nr:cytidine deaminase-like [Paramacrobiotus metropolitanus]